MRAVGIDVGSTTVKAVLIEGDTVLWRDYQRHHTRQAETVLDFLIRIEAECGLKPRSDSILFTGSGAGLIAPLVGGRIVQEVVAVAAAVEKLHPDVRFVSEIGGEDMKTIFFTSTKNGHAKQVYMQSACSGGTGTFIEKAAKKLQIGSDELGAMRHAGLSLHKISSKCGIFAEADANTLLKSGVPVDEIIASLFDAVVCQNLASMIKGNTPVPTVLLLGGPNLFFIGLQEAWRYHLLNLWAERGVHLTEGIELDRLIQVPAQALYYASLGCIEVGKSDAASGPSYAGTDRLRWWIERGQHEEKAQEGKRGLAGDEKELAEFLLRYGGPEGAAGAGSPSSSRRDGLRPGDEAVIVGCDLGSTTSKAVVLSRDSDVLFSCYSQSRGNPIKDAQLLMRQIRGAGFHDIGALALTGYGKDLLDNVLGADVAVVETVAHAEAARHFFPDVDVICDVGGCDVKIMLLRQGMVVDFRLNSQCSSGNGAFLQGVAERYEVPLEDYAERAFKATSIPSLAMGCGVFLQSDIVNQQRKGWSSDEIMASLAAVLPANVWIYAGQLQNLRSIGRRFVLQGGTHRNLAVVKAQVDFIRKKAPEAEILVHPYPGEAGAIGAALSGRKKLEGGEQSRFRGFELIDALVHKSTTSKDTMCRWCSRNCQRTFVDVKIPGAPGRPWSKIPSEPGWERVISGYSCPKGLVEDAGELRLIKQKLEEAKCDRPNLADLVRDRAFQQFEVTL